MEPFISLIQSDIGNVSQQEQLKTQMQTVKKFMAVNDSLAAFTKDSEHILHEELVSAHLP
ncbi:MAG: hypothetical protein JWQ71_879, partial [Pedosphaera sp.]|nr:hypothetical protein [Pedosphaera sp.]